MRGRRAEAGHTLAELLVALSLTAIVAAAAFGWLASELRWADALTRRAASADAFRLAELLLPQELRFLRPDRDVAAIATDSLAIRVLRGTGVVCQGGGASIVIRLRASRGPDAAKDSLLWLDAGDEVPLPVLDAASDPTGCPAGEGEAVFRLQTSPAPPTGAAVLLFERGAYHLQGSALRYRRGASGRQPLTGPVFDDSRSSFEGIAGASAVLLRLRSMAVARAAESRAWSGRLPLLNDTVAGAHP